VSASAGAHSSLCVRASVQLPAVHQAIGQEQRGVRNNVPLPEMHVHLVPPPTGHCMCVCMCVCVAGRQTKNCVLYPRAGGSDKFLLEVEKCSPRHLSRRMLANADAC
jgi:hypothetical protein